MKFGVIYTVDIGRENSIVTYLPSESKRRRLWTQTEGDEEYGYGYLEGYWAKGKHRKLVSVLLTREQFEDFLNDVYLYAEDVETGGILGAPWAVPWYGNAPAISFSNYDDFDCMRNAFVTPFPDISRKGELNEYDWEKIGKAVINYYGPRGAFWNYSKRRRRKKAREEFVGI